MVLALKSIALSSATEVMWSIMASFMLYVVDKYARDFYMEMLIPQGHSVPDIMTECERLSCVSLTGL